MKAQVAQPSLVQEAAPANKLLNNVLTWIVFIYQFVAVVVFFASIYLAIGWIKEPFIGSFYEHTLVFVDTGPVQKGAPGNLMRLSAAGISLLRKSCSGSKSKRCPQGHYWAFLSGWQNDSTHCTICQWGNP